LTCGAFTPTGDCLELPQLDLERLEAAWQEAVFALYLAEEKIEPEVVANMRPWEHSGFSVDQSVLLAAGDQAYDCHDSFPPHGVTIWKKEHPELLVDRNDIPQSPTAHTPFTQPVAEFVELAHPHGLKVFPCINRKAPQHVAEENVSEGFRGVATNWYRVK